MTRPPSAWDTVISLGGGPEAPPPRSGRRRHFQGFGGSGHARGDVAARDWRRARVGLPVRGGSCSGGGGARMERAGGEARANGCSVAAHGALRNGYVRGLPVVAGTQVRGAGVRAGARAAWLGLVPRGPALPVGSGPPSLLPPSYRHDQVGPGPGGVAEIGPSPRLLEPCGPSPPPPRGTRAGLGQAHVGVCCSPGFGLSGRLCQLPPTVGLAPGPWRRKAMSPSSAVSVCLVALVLVLRAPPGTSGCPQVPPALGSTTAL